MMNDRQWKLYHDLVDECCLYGWKSCRLVLSEFFRGMTKNACLQMSMILSMVIRQEKSRGQRPPYKRLP